MIFWGGFRLPPPQFPLRWSYGILWQFKADLQLVRCISQTFIHLPNLVLIENVLHLLCVLSVVLGFFLAWASGLCSCFAPAYRH